MIKTLLKEDGYWVDCKSWIHVQRGHNGYGEGASGMVGKENVERGHVLIYMMMKTLGGAFSAYCKRLAA